MGVLGLLLAAAEVPLDEAAHNLSFANTGFAFLICLSFAAVGVLLIGRRPRNPVGWLLATFALLVLAGDCVGDYSLLAYRFGHRSLPLPGIAATLATIVAVAPIILLPVPIMLFPDGRLTPRWRRVLRAYVGLGSGFICALVAGSVVAVTRGHVSVGSNGALTGVNSPHGPTAWLGTVDAVALIPAIPLALSPIVRQLGRYRAAGGLERAQLKWLLLGACGSMLAVAFFVAGLGNGNSALDDLLSSIAGSLFVALPAAMAVAILRYRLYDIDRLISRTLAYAILTALLVGTFIGVVALATDVLPFSSRVAVAASTLVAVALFNPLRVRVQRAVDRRFNRARYDAHATVAAFSARLRDAVELDSVSAELVDTVRAAVEPSHVSLWLR